MKLITAKVVPALGISLASVLLLSACVGGAQNQDPSADDPGSSDNRTNPAQANKNACGLASDAVLQKLSDVSSNGPARVGWTYKSDGGWYVAAPLGDNATLSKVVGLWATKGDPTLTDFDGTLYALNDDAQTQSSSSTAAPSSFSADSSGAKQALSCEKSTDD